MKHQNIKPFYPLKVTKFLLKFSQFEFLVTTEQSLLVYKFFLSLNIPDFSLFFVEKLQPPEKSHPLFPSNSPLKTHSAKSPPFWKFGRRLNPFPQQKGGEGVHTVIKQIRFSYQILLIQLFFYQVTIMFISCTKKDSNIYSLFLLKMEYCGCYLYTQLYNLDTFSDILVEK